MPDPRRRSAGLKTVLLFQSPRPPYRFPAWYRFPRWIPQPVSYTHLNLVENAAKYNRENGSIFISASQQQEDVIIKIEDTGIGIPKEECERIFEPFYRVDQSRSRSIGGAGLGLALVKDIVEKHRGTIQVHSRAGQGSEFILYL